MEVELINQDIATGVTIHWHGVNVSNAEDGVAGVTQNAVPPDRRHEASNPDAAALNLLG